jgi:hypothetical protein
MDEEKDLTIDSEPVTMRLSSKIIAGNQFMRLLALLSKWQSKGYLPVVERMEFRMRISQLVEYFETPTFEEGAECDKQSVPNQ